MLLGLPFLMWTTKNIWQLPKDQMLLVLTKQPEFELPINIKDNRQQWIAETLIFLRIYKPFRISFSLKPFSATEKDKQGAMV